MNAAPPPLPVADWSRLHAEPDVVVPLPGGLEMLFRRIPAGSFWMGTRGGEADEEPRHRVVISREFWLGKFVVTQAEWRAVAALSAALTASPGLDPSNKRNTGERRPVTEVSCDDAVAWSEVVTPLLAACRDLPPGLVARLPTEAEWEYACRAGSETEYSSGDGEAALAEVGWYGEQFERGAHEVGRKPANAAGLYDMHGNVWEWCRGPLFGDSYRRRIDGSSDPEGTVREGVKDEYYRRQRVMRGGSWDFTPGWCRSAFRSWLIPGYPAGSRGFRLCLAPGPVAEPRPEQEPAKADPGPGDGGRGTSPESDGQGAAGAPEWRLSEFTLPAKPAEK